MSSANVKVAAVVLASALIGAAGPDVERRDGGIVRGDTARRALALVFTGHEFAEGGTVILDQLARHRAKASFFLTGDFLRRKEFRPLVARMVAEGHYVGPHSDRHLLYCSWDDRRTLVEKAALLKDVGDNLAALEARGIPRSTVRYWLPAYEWYNADVAAWSAEIGLQLVNMTPGTRSNADYTGEADAGFVTSTRILESIAEREGRPDGLNGFLLLMHVGAGPGRRDKLHDRLGELLTLLDEKGYRLVRVDELLR